MSATITRKVNLEKLIVKRTWKLPLPQNAPHMLRRATKRVERDQARDWARRSYQVLYEALTAFRPAPKKEARVRQSFIDSMTKRVENNTAIDWLKFNLSYVVATALDQEELPIVPAWFKGKPGVLGGGWIYKTCLNLMGRKTVRNRQAAYSLGMSKYAMPEAPKSLIKASLVKHAKAFGTPDCDKIVRGAEPDKDKIRESHIRDKITGIVERLYSGTRMPKVSSLPSPSACFERSREKGGQLVELLERFSDSVKGPCLVSDELVGMTYLPWCNRTVGYYRSSDPWLSLFRGWFDAELHRWIATATCLKARAIGIPEPLKVRVVTAGEAVPYYACMEIQKLLHSKLKTVPAFKFTGEEISLDDIAKTFYVAPEGCEIVSGDYSAATDNLRRSLIKWTWKMISRCLCLTSDIHRLGELGLFEHELHYKDEVVRQRSGQPMGSPLSFPLLCIINAASFLAAYDLPETALWDYPVRINGDDIVFMGPSSKYDEWWRYNRLAGLNPSPGKNFRMKDCLVMNSQMFQLGGRPRHLPFVNLSLLMNVVRKGPLAGQTANCPWTELHSKWRQLKRGFADSKQAYLRERFLLYNRLPSVVPNDLPILLGGPGISLDTFSEEARLYAGYWFTRHGGSQDYLRKAEVLFSKRPTARSPGILGDTLRDWMAKRTVGRRVAVRTGDITDPTGWDTTLGKSPLFLGLFPRLLSCWEQGQASKLDLRELPGARIQEGGFSTVGYERRLQKFYSGIAKYRAAVKAGDCFPSDSSTLREMEADWVSYPVVIPECKFRIENDGLPKWQASDFLNRSLRAKLRYRGDLDT